MRSLREILQSTADVFSLADESLVVEMTSRTPEDDTPLHVLLWRRDVEGALALAAAGADLDALGDMGETPLHVVVTQDLIDALGPLISAGADPNIRSEFGDTPRERAINRGGACAKFFTSGGA